MADYYDYAYDRYNDTTDTSNQQSSDSSGGGDSHASEVQEYDEDLRAITTAVGTALRLDIPKTSGKERIQKCEELKGKVKRAQQLLRSYNMELKSLPSGSKYHAKGKEYERILAKAEADIRNAINTANQPPGGGSGDVRGPNGEPSARDMTQQALAVQEESKASTGRSKAIVANTIQIGMETANALEQQTEMIKGIDAKVDIVEGNLDRASKQLKALIRRLATDKLILSMTLVLALVVLGAVVVAFLAPKGSEE